MGAQSRPPVYYKDVIIYKIHLKLGRATSLARIMYKLF